MSLDRQQVLNDPEAAIRTALDGRQATTRTAMPAIVTSVDFTAMTVEVQPAIQAEITNPDNTTQFVNLPILADVPIVFPSAGGFSLTLPIAIGDEVLVIIADRCIDAWWQLGGVNVPIEMRMNDLSDGFAIPGPRSQPRVIGSISSTNAQLRNDAGTLYLELTPSGQVNITAPSGMTFTTPTATFTGDIVIEGNATMEQMLTVEENVTVDGELITDGEISAGSLNVVGSAVVDGSISAASATFTTEATIDGIPFTEHIHGGVQTGSGVTGTPGV